MASGTCPVATWVSVSSSLRNPAVADKGELGAEDRWHPHLARRLGETDDAVEAVVIGEGERFEAETRRLGDELLGV